MRNNEGFSGVAEGSKAFRIKISQQLKGSQGIRGNWEK